MTTKQVTKSSSVRIDTQLKNSIQDIAIFYDSTITNILNQALTQYITEQKNIQKISKIKQILEDSKNSENWTSDEETKAIRQSRNNKKITQE